MLRRCIVTLSLLASISLARELGWQVSDAKLVQDTSDPSFFEMNENSSALFIPDPHSPQEIIYDLKLSNILNLTAAGARCLTFHPRVHVGVLGYAKNNITQQDEIVHMIPMPKQRRILALTTAGYLHSYSVGNDSAIKYVCAYPLPKPAKLLVSSGDEAFYYDGSALFVISFQGNEVVSQIKVFQIENVKKILTLNQAFYLLKDDSLVQLSPASKTDPIITKFSTDVDRLVDMDIRQGIIYLLDSKNGIISYNTTTRKYEIHTPPTPADGHFKMIKSATNLPFLYVVYELRKKHYLVEIEIKSFEELHVNKIFRSVRRVRELMVYSDLGVVIGESSIKFFLVGVNRNIRVADFVDRAPLYYVSAITKYHDVNTFILADSDQVKLVNFSSLELPRTLCSFPQEGNYTLQFDEKVKGCSSEYCDRKQQVQILVHRVLPQKTVWYVHVFSFGIFMVGLLFMTFGAMHCYNLIKRKIDMVQELQKRRESLKKIPAASEDKFVSNNNQHGKSQPGSIGQHELGDPELSRKHQDISQVALIPQGKPSSYQEV